LEDRAAHKGIIAQEFEDLFNCLIGGLKCSQAHHRRGCLCPFQSPAIAEKPCLVLRQAVLDTPFDIDYRHSAVVDKSAEFACKLAYIEHKPAGSGYILHNGYMRHIYSGSTNIGSDIERNRSRT